MEASNIAVLSLLNSYCASLNSSDLNNMGLDELNELNSRCQRALKLVNREFKTEHDSEKLRNLKVITDQLKNYTELVFQRVETLSNSRTTHTPKMKGSKEQIVKLMNRASELNGQLERKINLIKNKQVSDQLSSQAQPSETLHGFQNSCLNAHGKKMSINLEATINAFHFKNRAINEDEMAGLRALANLNNPALQEIREIAHVTDKMIESRNSILQSEIESLEELHSAAEDPEKVLSLTPETALLIVKLKMLLLDENNQSFLFSINGRSIYHCYPLLTEVFGENIGNIIQFLNTHSLEEIEAQVNKKLAEKGFESLDRAKFYHGDVNAYLSAKDPEISKYLQEWKTFKSNLSDTTNSEAYASMLSLMQLFSPGEARLFAEIFQYKMGKGDDELGKERPDPALIFNNLSVESLYLFNGCLQAIYGEMIAVSQTKTSEDMQHVVNLVENLESKILYSWEKKKYLLNQLEEEAKRATTDQEKQRVYVKYKQIVENPFEPLLVIYFVSTEAELDSQESSRAENQIKTSKLHVYMPHLLQIIDNPKDSQNKPFSLFNQEAKLEGLKAMRDYALAHPNGSSDPILISGAGVGGLTCSLMCAAQGLPFDIIEQRGEPERENIIALGKEEDPSYLETLKGSSLAVSSDVKILNFFGVTDRLLEGNQANLDRIDKGVLEVRIKDLQLAMRDQLTQLVGFNPIQTGFTIKAINSTDQQTQLMIYNPHTRMNEERNYKKVIVAEGAHSTTRDLLGVEVRNKSKTSYISFSFFEKPDSHQVARTVKNTTYLFKGLPGFFKTATRIGFQSLFASRDEDRVDIFFKSMKRGILLLNAHEIDYLYTTLNKEEEAKIKELESSRDAAISSFDIWRTQAIQELEGLEGESHQLLIQELRGLHPRMVQKLIHYRPIEWKNKIEHLFRLAETTFPPSADPKKVLEFKKMLAKHRKTLEKFEKLSLEMHQDPAKNYRQFMNLAMGILGSKNSIDYKHYQRTDVVPVRVTESKEKFVKRGDSRFYLTGDSSSTTDPASGSGARSAINEMSFMYAILAESESAMSNPLLPSIHHDILTSFPVKIVTRSG